MPAPINHAQQEFQAFLERHPVRSFKKQEIIIFQGEAPRAAFAVKSGTVKAYNLSVNGDEKPVAFYAPGSIFPGAWLYGKMANAIYYYEAFTPEVSLYSVDRDALVEFIKQHPDLLYQELERSVTDQLGTSMRLNALQHSRASDKLVYTLHYLALSHGTPTGSGEVEISLNLTHQDFANLTGLTRETAATELNKLKRRGVIDYDKHRPYRLSLTKLAQLLNDQYIADVQVKL
ncbi:MAG TPA: Crp/Fnr family transcriptional regulator [Candidatus Saccharimonadales bacterium]|nr:Crp/Fnr family transcriptional regulator [Candidatus Saccharimonadales bacterium]